MIGFEVARLYTPLAPAKGVFDCQSNGLFDAKVN